jgi:hypothetical protein
MAKIMSANLLSEQTFEKQLQRSAPELIASSGQYNALEGRPINLQTFQTPGRTVDSGSIKVANAGTRESLE